MKRRPLVLSLLVLLLAACGGGTGGTAAETAAGPGGDTVDAPVGGDNTGPEGDTGEVFCSATDSGNTLSEQELPEPVAQLRERLFAAAGECDYAQLGTLAQARDGFNHSFGGEGSPEQFWRGQETNFTGEPMYALQIVLSLPVAQDGAGSYVWPSAAVEGATDADWQAVVDSGLYLQEELDEMRAAGAGYTGWRTAITPDGEWQYFVAGD